MARAKVSRDHPLATVIGSRKRPKVERMPKPTRAIRHPATITTTGVRQPGAGLTVDVDMARAFCVGRVACRMMGEAAGSP